MGTEVTRKTVPYLKIFGTDIIPVGTDKFYLCAGIKDKKQGISVECFNLNLESQWVYSKLPEKSRYFYTDAIVNSRGDIALLYNEKSVDDRILFIDANGNELADTLINVGEMDKYTPYKLYFKTADELLILADYGTFNKESHMTTPIGLNIKHFTLKGEEIGNQNLSFETIQKQYGNKDPFGKPVNEPTPSLRIVDIQNVNGKTSLIAESYYFSQRIETISANPPAQPTTEVYKTIALLDLYLIDLENLETAVWRFWKPARTLSLKGIKFYDATDLCDLLEEKSLFSYQGIVDNEILIRGFSQNHEYFNRIPLNMHWEDISTRTYFGLPLSANYYSREYIQNFDLGGGFSPIPGMRSSGFFHFENHLTFYRFHRPTGNLQFTIIK